VGLWTGSSWLRIETGGRYLWRRYWTFWFHKMRGISWLAENRFASQEELCSIEEISLNNVREFIYVFVSTYLRQFRQLLILKNHNFQFPYIYFTFQQGWILNCKPQSIFTKLCSISIHICGHYTFISFSLLFQYLWQHAENILLSVDLMSKNAKYSYKMHQLVSQHVVLISSHAVFGPVSQRRKAWWWMRAEIATIRTGSRAAACRIRRNN
jgi:hypothetical protein